MSHLYYYQCFMGFWTCGLSCPFECRSILIRSALILTLLAFGGTSNFSSGITLCHNINPFCHYLAPSGMDITYDLGVFPHGVDITVTGCHRLTLGAFCSQTGCWGSSGGSPWHGHHACPCFLPLEKTAALLLGALVTAGRVLLHLCFPFSEMSSSALPYSDIIDSRAEITLLLEIDDNNLNTGNF